MTIRDLLTPGRTTSSSIQYPQETGFTNSAATHTETDGTAKTQSEIKFDIKTATVTTIAHWVLATRQLLDAVAMLPSYIEGRQIGRASCRNRRCQTVYMSRVNVYIIKESIITQR